MSKTRAELEAENNALRERLANPAPIGDNAAPVVEADPDQEFKSVSITIDHLIREPQEEGDGETALKFVLSTFHVTDALLKNVSYFMAKGEGRNVLADRDTMLLLGRAHDKAHSVYIYTPSERLTNVMVSMDTWAEFVESEGTMYGGAKALVALALKMTHDCHVKGLSSDLIVALRD